MLNRVLRFLAVLALVVVAFVIVCSQPPTLPIYRLAPPNVSVGTIPGPVGSLLGPGATVSETADRVYYRSGPLRLEVYKSSGGFWLEDSTQLWNPDLTPQLRDSSLFHPPATAKASRSRRHTNGFARDSAFTSFEFTGIRPTLVGTRSSGGQTSTVKLDWRVGYAARVGDRRPWARRFEVTGGGGEFKVHYGDQGRVIGYHGVWREIRGIAFRERVVPRAVADAQYLSMVEVTHPVIFEPPHIAYYSEPAPFAQARLYPVYVYSGMEIAGGDTILLRTVTIPATRAQPQPGMSQAPLAPPRSEADLPRPGSTAPESPAEGAAGSPAIGREVAASWIGAIAGLPTARDNAMGLLQALGAKGWAINFQWGDADAWYGDWNDDRADWADATDLLFYTGHAGMDGWDLYDHQPVAPEFPPSYMRLSNYDVGAASGGMYGHQDLEWIVIAACGPLQDDLLSAGGGDAIQRWSPAFGGLHLLLGYGAVSYDNPNEGRLFAKYALEGKTLVDAWLRTAAETQPSFNGRSSPDGPDIWAGAMWARKFGKISPRWDHLWGRGPVAEDPVVPDDYGIIWTPT